MKNLKIINMTESNFEKKLKDLFEKYNIESDKKAEQFTDEEKTKEEIVDLAIAVEHKGRSYVVEHIDIYDNEQDPRAPYNSHYSEYFQLYINGRKASGASSFDWFKYNMSNDYQIVPKIVRETLIKNICDEEIKIVEYYRNRD